MELKILVIDDEKIVRTAFERELGREGYKVDSASDGMEAILKVRSEKYDLIFIDMVIPVMDGIQTCKAIKEASPDSIQIFMTGKVDMETIWNEIEFTKAGGKVYYLYKPFGDNEILDVIKKALAEKQA